MEYSYQFDGVEITRDEAEQIIMNEFDMKGFEKHLNDREPPATILGNDYPAGTALRLVDPVMFDALRWEWMDWEMTDLDNTGRCSVHGLTLGPDRRIED